MRKNYNSLLKSKGIFKYFKFVYKNRLDIYDSHTMEYNLRTTWAKLTYDDLKYMKKTIKKEIDYNSYINSISFTGLGIILAIAIAFVGAFVGMYISDEDVDKSDILFYLKTVSITFITLVIIPLAFFNWRHQKNVKLQTIVYILMDIKKSEQNT